MFLFRLVSGAGCGIRLYRFLIIAFSSTGHFGHKLLRPYLSVAPTLNSYSKRDITKMDFNVCLFLLFFVVVCLSSVLGKRQTTVNLLPIYYIYRLLNLFCETFGTSSYGEGRTSL